MESYDGFVVPFKKNLKDLLFDILITERSFENFSYLSSCSFSWRRGIPFNVLRGIESDRAHTKVSVVTSEYIFWSKTYGTQ